LKITKPIYYLILGFNLIHPWLREQFEYLLFYKAIKKVKNENFDNVIAFDLSSALLLKRLGFNYIFDSHAYLPREFDSRFVWRLTEYRFVRYSFSKIKYNIVSLFSEGDLANQLYKKENIFLGESFTVPLYSNFKNLEIPKSVESKKIKVIHHGGANRDRKLERLVDIILACDERFELYFMLLPENKYLKFLKNYKKSERIKFIQPVPMDKIPEKLNSFDLSLIVFGSKEFHHKYTSVPNKFWESIQGRVPIIASPHSAMAPIIKKLNVGFLPDSDTNEAYVNLINSITIEKINEKKMTISALAYEHSLEGFKPKFLQYFNSLPQSTSSKK